MIPVSNGDFPAPLALDGIKSILLVLPELVDALRLLEHIEKTPLFIRLHTTTAFKIILIMMILYR